VINEEF